MIVNRINGWAKTTPNKTAVTWSGSKLSYLAFAKVIEISRIFFAEHNLPAGKTAVVVIHNIRDAWMCMLGLRLLGLNTICVKSPNDAEELKLKDVACIVVTEAENPTLNVTGPLAGTKVIAVPNAIYAKPGATNLPAEPYNPQLFGGHILYTSGTTGSFKKVLFEGSKDDARNASQARFRNFSRNTLYHGMHFPLWSGIGFKCPAALWHMGGTVLIDQRSEAFKEFFSQNITYACIVPPALKDLLKEHRTSEGPKGNFEMMVGGGHLTQELASQTVEKLTTNITNCFASTELSTPIMRTSYRTVDDLHWLTPESDATVQIIDDKGNECAVDQEGELRIGLRSFDSSGYLDDPEATARIYRDGFFYPGDQAVRRADGRIRILGRTGDVLTLRGMKTAVAPIEQLIQKELEVEEVCLFSQMSETGREELAICLQTDRKIEKSVLDALMKKFGKTDLIRVFVIKQFPRTETGMRKVRRAELKKRVFNTQRK